VSYLIDTNVISELARPKPAREVVIWFEEVADEALHLSVLTLGELRRSVERLPVSKRKEKLRY
jgi:toxin FitB